MVFVKLDIRYADNFLEYSNYFGIALRLLKFMRGMNNSWKLFSDELTDWLLESGLININVRCLSIINMHQTQKKIVVLSYVDDCVYWYTSEALEKQFVDTLGKRFHMNFLVHAHWFISIRISQMKAHSIEVYHARYATSIVAKYLNNVTAKASTKFYNTTFTYDMIFTKANASTRYD